MSAQAVPTTARRAATHPRHRARAFVVQGLYQHLVAAQDLPAIEAQAAEVGDFKKCDVTLYRTLLKQTLAAQAELYALLTPYVDRPLTQISPIERAILLLGALELRDHLQTPARVILNETIELAKTFGGADGHKFVNGILDKLAQNLRATEMRSTRQA